MRDNIRDVFSNFGSQVNSAAQWLNPVSLGSQLGSNFGSAIQTYENNITDKEMAYNSAEAQKNREWQEYMSNTAIQRQVEDLKKAGLNPWLALQGGINGASTPSGASSSYNSAFAQTFGLTQGTSTIVKAVTSLVNSASQVISKIASIAAAA